MNFLDISIRWVHDCGILFAFVCGLGVAVGDDLELRAGLIDVLVPDNACLDINVEALSARCKVGTDSVTDGKVVPLRGDWGSQGSAEWIDDGWVSTLGLLWLFEVLLHQGAWVVREERELLMLGHGVVAGTKEL